MSASAVTRELPVRQIHDIVRPSRLLLSWQPPDGTRSRLVVGELLPPMPGSSAIFRYLANTPDFREAVKRQFTGYPAFRLGIVEHRSHVLGVFMARLPSRNRADFPEFLRHHRLPQKEIADYELLTYTGARLPGDSFELIPDFNANALRLQLIMEASGFRHQSVDPSTLAVGDPVQLLGEPQNPHDRHAVAMLANEVRIGYVNRVISPRFSKWIVERTVIAEIDRIDARSDRPAVYVFVSVSPTSVGGRLTNI